ncbi:MAG: GAF domain-containing protein [Lachnospiraceae bacterium]|nr:GAF domain-containing protein [Lachnospiraceae bacterium]
MRNDSDIKAYRQLARQLEGLFEGETDLIANLANASALLNEALEDINWVGFYFLKEKINKQVTLAAQGADETLPANNSSAGKELVLGPFQGRAACVRIPIGKGVCGTAVQQDQVQRVMDVHQFPGHIACDCASRSEIVLPLHANGQIAGVLDIDSPLVGRFTEEDQEGLLLCAAVIEKMLCAAAALKMPCVVANEHT